MAHPHLTAEHHPPSIPSAAPGVLAEPHPCPDMTVPPLDSIVALTCGQGMVGVPLVTLTKTSLLLGPVSVSVGVSCMWLSSFVENKTGSCHLGPYGYEMA